MDAQVNRQVSIVGFVLSLIGIITALYVLVPTELDFYKLFFLCAVASVAGAGFWNGALWVTKKLGLEFEETNPFGGQREPNLYGGIAFGLFYFLPLGLTMVFVDTKIYHLPVQTAASAHALSLLGTMAGSALFYGPKIRQRVQRRRWSQGKQESWLVVVWSFMLVTPAILLYEVGKVIWVDPTSTVQAGLAALAIFGSVLVCYLSVLFVLALAHEFTRFTT